MGTAYQSNVTTDYDGRPTGSNNVVAGTGIVQPQLKIDSGDAGKVSAVLYTRTTDSGADFVKLKTFVTGDPPFHFNATGLDFCFVISMNNFPSQQVDLYY